MGLFDRLLGRRSSAPPLPNTDAPSPGWEAIDAALARLYPGQEPRHLANNGVRWMHDLSGTANPLDGVHIFDAGSFWHYVGLGLTELYGKQSKDPLTSGLGYELTFRLGKEAGGGDPTVWPVSLMNGLARPAMRGEMVFDTGHTVRTGPLAPDGPGPHVGVLIHEDPGLPPIETAHGRIKFLQLVPVEAAVLERAGNGNTAAVLADLAKLDPTFVMRLE